MARKLTVKEIREFFKMMCTDHPLDRKLRISLTLSNGPITRGDVVLRGTVMREIGSDKVDIYVDRTQEPVLTLKTLAHEYRHIMQWVNMDWHLDGDNKMEKEIDAQKWGGRVAREYWYGRSAA